jgi:hypothetical protein
VIIRGVAVAYDTTLLALNILWKHQATYIYQANQSLHNIISFNEHHEKYFYIQATCAYQVN